MPIMNLPFTTQGYGPDLLLLHGYGGRPQTLRLLVENLSPFFRVIVPDLGDLYLNKKQHSFNQQIELLNDWIRARVYRPNFDILGMSYGGALGWGLSLTHPDIVNKLILVNPMCPQPFQSLRSLQMSTFLRMPQWAPLLEIFLSSPFGKSFLYSAREIFRDTRLENMDLDNLRGRKLLFVAGMIRQFSWILNQEHWQYWHDRLPENSKQSLLICDRKDPLFHFRSYEQFAQNFGVQEILHIDGAGHIPHPKHYSLIADSVLSFILREQLSNRLA